YAPSGSAQPVPAATLLNSEPKNLAPHLHVAGGADGAGAGSLLDSDDTNVRYFDGIVSYASNDLDNAGFGLPWDMTRAWSNEPSYSLKRTAGGSGTTVGSGWSLSSLPQIIGIDGNKTLAVVSDGTNARYFDFDQPSKTYVER